MTTLGPSRCFLAQKFTKDLTLVDTEFAQRSASPWKMTLSLLAPASPRSQCHLSLAGEFRRSHAKALFLLEHSDADSPWIRFSRRECRGRSLSNLVRRQFPSSTLSRYVSCPAIWKE